ncbi:lipolytic protein G-D-S-L family [Planococcus donghaensis MPA1U2]|uniref:Lipolytic protein G-D-S-L family n=1 Tax=Planococcus donghaensis MPA1U2 TaxID=933115 RepID=E7RD25_9BACL|nr:GDSL-type esterase/lipase family protein [Planococcus donghaensis]EGA91089.1 lipolytic protein G-D-S-L family [Planococcus donghaensis MPA1U2]
MKKLLQLLIAVFLVLSLGPLSVSAENNHGKDLLVSLGDSVPYGYNLGKNNNQPSKAAFPYLIGEKADLRVRNLSAYGWQTSDLLTAIETNKKYQKAIHHADYITITIAGNDFIEILRAANAESGGDSDLFKFLIQQKLSTSKAFNNLAEIINEIRTLSDAPIVLYNMYNPFQTNDPLHNIANLFLPQVNATFAELAHNFNDVHIADAYNAFGNNQEKYVLPQDIHPTKAGQKKLAKIGIKAFHAEHVTHH